MNDTSLPMHKMKDNDLMHREVLGFMDKVIIVGTYEFIGFQLCLSLLEQGIEVIGIHLNTTF